MLGATPYAQTLRAIGQSLANWQFQDFELKTINRDFLVRGEGRAPPQRRSILRTIFLRAQHSKPTFFEFRYTPEDIEQLEIEGQSKRRDPQGMPDFSKLPQILRTLGAYMDMRGIRLHGIHRQGVRLTLQYKKPGDQLEVEDHTIPSFYKLFTHLVKQRKGRYP
ncbi:MAG: hypothetical protein ACE5HC_01995 [Candidatus Binatia bacterium]